MDDLSQLANAAHAERRPLRRGASGETPAYLLILVSASVTAGVSLLAILCGVGLIVYWSSDRAYGKLASDVGTDQGFALVAVGLGGVLVSAVALAVRDIARNSWRR